MSSLSSRITHLRKINNIPQSELAEKLGVSRPTMIAIEKGERELTISELKQIAEVLDMPMEILLDEEMSMAEQEGFMGYSKRSLKRFQDLILQCIKFGADEDGKITKTKLAKLVYLCDFASYYEYLKPISGFSYRKLAQGPVAIEFFDFIDTDESICLENKGRATMVSLNEQPGDTDLSDTEVELIRKICAKWKGKKTQEIVEFTHEQIPWKACRDGEVIPYALINAEAPDDVY